MKPINAKLAVGILLCAAIALGGCAGPAKTGDASRADRSGGKPRSSKLDGATQTNFDRAVSMMKSGNYAGATPVLESLTKEQPTLAAAYANLGIAYLKTNRLNDSDRAFSKATSLNPKSAQYWNYLGIALRHEGKFDDAKAAYDKALQADPKFRDAHLNMGILMDLYVKNPTEALAHYQAYQAQTEPKDKQVDKWIAELEKRIKSSAAKSKGTTP